MQYLQDAASALFDIRLLRQCRWLALVYLGVFVPVVLFAQLAVFISEVQAETNEKPLIVSGLPHSPAERVFRIAGLPYDRTLTPQGRERLIQRLESSGLFLSIALEEESSQYRLWLEPRQQIVEVRAEGAEAFSTDELRRIARIRLGTYVDQLDREEVLRRILVRYEDKGYRKSRVELQTIEVHSDFFSQALFAIEEGYQSKIASVQVSGQFPDDVADIPERLRSDALGMPASKEQLEELRQNILIALRREGYLQATVSAPAKRLTEDRRDYSLSFDVQVGEPLSLVFQGNSVFTAEELLRPLRIETRTVPFTPGAIAALTREIETKYQERGYLDVLAYSQELPSERSRKRFLVTVEEGPLVRCASVGFRGNKIFSELALSSEITTTAAGSWLTRRWRPGFVLPSQLQIDIERIKERYADLGYFDTQVTAEIVRREQSNWVSVEFVIEEGPQREVEEVELVWEDILSGSIPNELLIIESRIEEGEPFSLSRLREEQRRLFTDLRSRGFVQATVEMQGDSRTGSVRYLINPGMQVRIQDIAIRGLVFTNTFVVDREVLVAPGEVWDVSAVEASQQKIAELGLFREVRIEPLDGTLDQREESLVVQLKERPTGRFELGGAFTTQDGLHLFGELGQRNFLGRGEKLRMAVDAYVKSGSSVLDAGSVRLGYTIPRIASSENDFLSEAFYQSNVQLVDEYSFDRFGAWFSLHRDVLSRTRVIAGISGFRDSLYDVQPDVVVGPRDTDASVYIMPGISFDVDLRDNRLSPTSGYRSVVDVKVASEDVFSDVSMFYGAWKQSLLHPFGTRVVWANSIALELVEPFGSTEVIPLSQRLFLGGQNSLRGFSKNKVGPRSTLGTVVGGDRAFTASTELRYALTEAISAVVFLDAGQAFLAHEGSFEGESTDVSDLRYSPGFGAHYTTPIGPIRGEIGFPLERRSSERTFRINIAIGSAY